MAANSGVFSALEFEATSREAPHIFAACIFAFLCKSRSFANRINTQQNVLCRGQQPPYMQTLVLNLINHWRLLTVPAIVITTKSCGAEAVLSVVMQNQISDYRLPVPLRWLHPLSAGTVSKQICMICFDPSCARQEIVNADSCTSQPGALVLYLSTCGPDRCTSHPKLLCSI